MSNEAMLCFLVSTLINECPSKRSVPCFSHFCAFCCDFTVSNSPKFSAEAPSSVVKCKKAVMCLEEKIDVLGKLRSGLMVPWATTFMLTHQLCIKYGRL